MFEHYQKKENYLSHIKSDVKEFNPIYKIICLKFNKIKTLSDCLCKYRVVDTAWQANKKNKNDNIHKNEVQDTRWSDEYWQVQISCKYYRISYYIKINLTKNNHSKIYDKKTIISRKNFSIERKKIGWNQSINKEIGL